jgi:hypothetical protein
MVMSGCEEEEPERERFGSDGGTAGATSTTSSGGGFGAGGQGGVAPTGGGGTGGADTFVEVCVSDSMTVGNLQLTKGDGEFDGNGPVVTTTVGLTAYETLVVLEACVTMEETQSDWTTGERCETQSFQENNSGLLGDTDFMARYTDDDHEVDNVLGEATTLDEAPGLVIGVQCVGDTSGTDICSSTAGDCSMCLFNFGCFRLKPL